MSPQSPVSLTVDLKDPGTAIPYDFAGLSFETGSERRNVHGVSGNLFDSANLALVHLFRELGIRNLRVGGGSVDRMDVNPTREDIDALFRFAHAAGVKIIYSLRLQNGNATDNASVAQYLWRKYRSELDCLAIGNEPDWHSFHIKDPNIQETTPGVPGTAYPSYLARWKCLAEAVADSVPGAMLTGPDAGSNYPVPGSVNTGYRDKSWTANFAMDILGWTSTHSVSLTCVTQHNYAGQDAQSRKLAPESMIDQMLSPAWVDVHYPALYHAAGTPALPSGVGYRLTESNSFSGGVPGGSNCFATALFALDYMHWWAAHHCAGINFHTTQWRLNGTIHLDENGSCQVYPMAYGIKAFTLGSQGNTVSLTTLNPDSLNLTAYAVRNADTLYITTINKEHGPGAREANVTIATGDTPGPAKVLFLTGPHGDVAATSGVLLGGKEIRNDQPWEGSWELLHPDGTGQHSVRVPASCAAIIMILLAPPGR